MPFLSALYALIPFASTYCFSLTVRFVPRSSLIDGQSKTSLAKILRAYVDCLHHKSSSNWLQYLRFAIIPAPHSLVAKLLEERTAIAEKMTTWLTAGGGGCLNLPIGEALLQMTERGQDVSFFKKSRILIIVEVLFCFFLVHLIIYFLLL
ncbi:unnamed protein product [Nippostrongylus brasiliensis]|uniref:Transmembrane protein n=1 Tax=Nippostrongylus brasiliensis TaxID=27835 RepID=A0A0N4XNN5_NIPBR|nr:unnamed protein product [Nippostrongylus brasiliensis]